MRHPFRAVPTSDREPHLTRRGALVAGLAAATAGPAAAAVGGMASVVESAARLPRLRSLLVARAGEPLLAETFRGPGLERAVNVKSIAKSVIAALVGAAIDRGVLEGVEQPIAPLLQDRLPRDPDPRLFAVTVGHLLSMQAGLERTSGPFYGRWVSSPDWVRFALARPFVAEPGAQMLYSTGCSHLLSAILTRETGRSTLALARAWLGEPLGITIPAWPTDPQGIYFGGNDMLLSPRSLLRFGELHRRRGVMDGARVLPAGWIEAAWTPRVHSPFTGDAYGYGWFIAEARGHPVRYAWGFGGQMLYVVPDLELTVVMTSDTDTPAGRTGYVRELHAVLGDIVAATGG